MGGRLLRGWLLAPADGARAIRDRLDAVEELAFRTTDRGKVRETLKSMHDLERLMSRIALSTAGPRDLMALSRVAGGSAAAALLLSRVPGAAASAACSASSTTWPTCATAIESRHRRRAAGARARRRRSIRDGVDGELDELRPISRSGKQVIAELEASERTRTGIASLKVRFNRVFGYYIEISKANLHARARRTTSASRRSPAASASSRRR